MKTLHELKREAIISKVICMVAAFALVNLAELMLATKDAMMHLLPPNIFSCLALYPTGLWSV
jgi:hypothetical protein